MLNWWNLKSLLKYSLSNASWIVYNFYIAERPIRSYWHTFKNLSFRSYCVDLRSTARKLKFIDSMTEIFFQHFISFHGTRSGEKLKNYCFTKTFQNDTCACWTHRQMKYIHISMLWSPQQMFKEFHFHDAKKNASFYNLHETSRLFKMILETVFFCL